MVKWIYWTVYPSIAYYGLMTMGWSIENTTIADGDVWVKLVQYFPANEEVKNE